MKEQKSRRRTAGLINPHGYILEYLNADRGQVMYAPTSAARPGPVTSWSTWSSTGTRSACAA
jgi:hypothetical protein